MTVSAIEVTAERGDETFRRSRSPKSSCTITAEGMYAARLASATTRHETPGGAADEEGGRVWFPERWTLGGPEPYRVPLPSRQPEAPGSEVLPMGDGRVLVHRVRAHRHVFALLHPTNPGTREIPLGTVDCPACTVGSGPGTGARHTPATAPHDASRPPRHPHEAPDPDRPASPDAPECDAVRLLPPVPGGRRAYALAVGARSTALWLVAGGMSGPRRIADLPGRCSGGAWLERTGRLLAVDQELDGRTKAVTVDLGRDCAVSPLLQITDESTDRLLLADPDSGLLLIRSDAPSPGHERLAWGVLGSTLPIRFPECLRLPDCAITPFAVQPGQGLTPERCAVALRVDGAAGSWLGVWRPCDRTLHHVAAPDGWLTGCGVWTREGVLHLPYATPAVPCGMARLAAPQGRGGWTRTSPGPGAAGARGGPGTLGTPGRPRPLSAVPGRRPGPAAVATGQEPAGPAARPAPAAPSAVPRMPAGPAASTGAAAAHGPSHRPAQDHPATTHATPAPPVHAPAPAPAPAPNGTLGNGTTAFRAVAAGAAAAHGPTVVTVGTASGRVVQTVALPNGLPARRGTVAPTPTPTPTPATPAPPTPPGQDGPGGRVPNGTGGHVPVAGAHDHDVRRAEAAVRFRVADGARPLPWDTHGTATHGRGVPTAPAGPRGHDEPAASGPEDGAPESGPHGAASDADPSTAGTARPVPLREARLTDGGIGEPDAPAASG